MAAVLAVLCSAASVVTYRWVAAYGVGPLRAAADEIVLPPAYALIGDEASGNALCLDECPQYSRRLSAAGSRADAYADLVAALQKAGYDCEKFCDVDHLGTWRRPGRTIEVSVFSATVFPQYNQPGMPFDPARDTYVDISVSHGP